MNIEKLLLELAIWEKMLAYIPIDSKDTEDKIARAICRKLIVDARKKIGIIDRQFQ